MKVRTLKEETNKLFHKLYILFVMIYVYYSHLVQNGVSLGNSKLIRSYSTREGKLNPYYLTGFTDGDGCFTVTVRKSPSNKIGWRVVCCFQIGLAIEDKDLLEKIQATWGVGDIVKPVVNVLHYRVTNIQDLINVIIPHFEKYSLITQKQADFKLFKEIVQIIKRGEHVKQEGLQQILNLRATLNKGLSENLKAAFPNTIAVGRPEVEAILIRDPNWLVGFVEAEGCFRITTIKQPGSDKIRGVGLEFSISQLERDKALLEVISQYLGCGRIYSRRDGKVEFFVRVLLDLTEKVIPFFLAHPIKGSKALNFYQSDFLNASEIISRKEHLTPLGLENIFLFLLKARMNSNRPGRTQSPLLKHNNMKRAYHTSRNLYNSNYNINDKSNGSSSLYSEKLK